VRKARFRDIADAIVCNQRFTATMQGGTAKLSTFNDSQFDGAAFEAQPDGRTDERTNGRTDERTSELVCEYSVLKLRACLLAGDYCAAFAASQRAEPRLWAVAGQIRGSITFSTPR
jgi:hypothetical protein